MDKIYIGGTLPNSLSNGKGTRFVIFFEGCIHECFDCHNEHLWDMKEEDAMTVEELCEMIEDQVPLITGITLSGGDPFMQAPVATKIAKFAHSLGLDVWTYTGYTYEMLEKIVKTNIPYRELLMETDTLVDGRYELELHNESLKYIGSSNQRILRIEGGKRIG